MTDYPKLQRGTKFRLLAGDGGSPTETFSGLCVITTLKFDMKIDTDDAMVIDCDNPDNLPVRQSVAKGITFDLSGSGKADFAKYKVIETAFLTGATKNYQVERVGSGAAGGGIWEGGAIITDLSMDKSENGIVTFSTTLKGQGLWAFTANS